MALHQHVLGSGAVDTARGTGLALGIGVREQHGSLLGQGPSQAGRADPPFSLTIATTVIALLWRG